VSRRSIAPPGAGACDFLADPCQSSLELQALWAAQATPAVLPLTTIRSDLAGPGLKAFDPDSPPLGASPTIAVLVEQLSIGACDPVVPSQQAGAALVIPLDDWFLSRLAHAAAFWVALQRGRWVDPFEPSAARRSRLILGLRTLDGRDHGASYRELARGIFGADRVPVGSSWKTHDLRSRIMRLVADANALRTRRYLTLIQPKRSRRA
jgi:hypothetical protein